MNYILALLLFWSSAAFGQQVSTYIQGSPIPGALAVGPGIVQTDSNGKAFVTSPTGVGQGTILSSPGLVATSWSGVVGNFQLGTASAPTTAAGPLLQLSKTQQVLSAACGGNALDASCDAIISAISTNTASSQMQVTGIFTDASSRTAQDAVGLFSIGDSLSGSTGIGTGAYLQGTADSGGGRSLGAEIRSANNTGVAGTFQSSGFSGTGALWLTAGGTAASAEAIGVGGLSGQSFLYGLACKSGSVSAGCIRDDSNSTSSIIINGTHSNAILTAASAGFVGFGTTPSANLHVSRLGNDSVQVFRITQGDRDYDFFRDTSTNALIIKNEASGSIIQFENSSGITQLAALETGACIGCTTATAVLGELAFPKITASGSAPGASRMKISAVPGTNAGTCKLIAYAGTSTTPVTIIDNVGSGC